jgi:hypothetical protein
MPSQETSLPGSGVDVQLTTHLLKDPNLAEGECALHLVVKVAVNELNPGFPGVKSWYYEDDQVVTIILGLDGTPQTRVGRGVVRGGLILEVMGGLFEASFEHL